MFASIIKNIRTKRLEKGWDQFHKSNYLEARKKVLRLTRCKDHQICEEANRIAGLAGYHKHLYLEAIPFLEKAASISNQQHDWYNLAMSRAKADLIEDSENAFMKIYSAKSHHGYIHAISVPTMIFQYMRALKSKKAFENAYQRVIELRAMYEAMRKSDDKLLMASGLPSVHNYVKEITPILEAHFNSQDAKEWLVDLSKRLEKNLLENMQYQN